MRRLFIAPSLLSADMADFRAAVKSVAREVDYIHCDVMDGHFVPNLTFGPPVIKAIKKIAGGVPLDVHLMIEKPIRWIPRFLDSGLREGDYLTFHLEAESDPRPGLQLIRDARVGAGLSIKPATPVGALLKFAHLLDQALIMTVEPGFGGQSFRRDMLPKVTAMRIVMDDAAVVAVDGGVDISTAPEAYIAGANLLIAGSSIYGAPRPAAAAKRIRQACLDGWERAEAERVVNEEA